MEQTDTPGRRNDYKIRGKRTWTLIRERYLAGESAPRLAEVFDVTEAAIRARARRQGWTKRDMAEAMAAAPADAGLAEVVAGELNGVLTAREAARLALGEAVTLLRGGKMGLAGEAARVADVMGRAAARLGDEAAVDVEPDEAAFEAVRRKVLGLAENTPSYRHPAASAARPEDPAARECATLSGAPGLTVSPSAPLGPPVCAADAACRRMTIAVGDAVGGASTNGEERD
ncbi:hypothetical protein [Brevundimonas sp.]|uniref:hypothetical protein n=1 Tax=Brevundimonas sp. TaxID=1871086 RepID=UPI003F70D260